MNQKEPSVLLLSGGVDSTVLLAQCAWTGTLPICLCFHYGQRHFREIDCARRIAAHYEAPFHLVQLSNIFGRSALVDGMSESFIVPNRNMVLMSIAAAFAESRGCGQVLVGCNANDTTTFPDCRRHFVRAVNRALSEAEVKAQVFAPYLPKTKREIIELGKSMEVPFAMTWSCYGEGPEPCGTCPACIQRHTAGLPIAYEPA